jgi:hypothetical protein
MHFSCLPSNCDSDEFAIGRPFPGQRFCRTFLAVKAPLSRAFTWASYRHFTLFVSRSCRSIVILDHQLADLRYSDPGRTGHLSGRNFGNPLLESIPCGYGSSSPVFSVIEIPDFPVRQPCRRTSRMSVACGSSRERSGLGGSACALRAIADPSRREIEVAPFKKNAWPAFIIIGH